MTRPRRNPIWSRTRYPIALDRLEDLGVPAGEILAVIRDFETPWDEYSRLVTWLWTRAGLRDRATAAQERAFREARTAAERGWDAADNADPDFRIEKQRVEYAFNLLGDELADGAWYFDRNGDWERVPFWYDGVPEWDVDKERLQSDEYRTVMTDWGGPMATSAKEIEDEHGVWILERVYRTSGERRCPIGADYEEFVSAKHARDGRCPMCDEPIGAEHGFIYLGDGWGEFIYRHETPEGDEEYYDRSGERRRRTLSQRDLEGLTGVPRRR